MNNAMQNVPKGSHIERSGTREGDRVRITLSEDGPGVPDAAKQRLFDRFGQTGQETAGGQRGG